MNVVVGVILLALVAVVIWGLVVLLSNPFVQGLLVVAVLLGVVAMLNGISED